MLAIIDSATGALIKIASSINGEDMTGRTTATPPQGYDPVAQSHLWQGGQWVINPNAGVAPPPRPIPVEVHSDASATLTLTNLPAAAQFLANTQRFIEPIDLYTFTQAKLNVRVLVAGVAGATLAVRYATTFSTSIAAYQQIGVSEVACSLATVGAISSGWIDLVPGAIGADRFVTIRQMGGTGTSPNAQIGRVTLWLR